MATIQIRNIPDEDYQALRDAAKKQGQSLQAYMREQTELMARRARRRAMVENVDAVLARHPDGGLSRAEIVDELRAIRGD